MGVRGDNDFEVEEGGRNGGFEEEVAPISGPTTKRSRKPMKRKKELNEYVMRTS